MEKNFYDILGITEEEKNLSQSEFEKILKKNYRELSKKWHPDRYATKSETEKQEAEDKFKEITEAYNTLSDSTKRQQYDFSQNGGGMGGFDDIDPFSFFRNMHGGFGQQQRVAKGQNVQVEIQVTLEDVFNGGEKEVEYDVLRTCRHCNGTGSANGKTETCSACNGSGMITDVQRRGNMQTITQRPCPHCHGTGRKITNPCPKCHGDGTEVVKEKEKITIPKGINSGQYYVIQGKGCEPKASKGVQTINGDLIVIFTVVNNHDFTREGDNLIYKLKVNVYDALLGCDKKIKTIDGKEITINIPECTNHGHIFTIKGKGLPNMNNSQYVGDMKVIVTLVMPKSLSNKDREHLKKLR